MSKYSVSITAVKPGTGSHACGQSSDSDRKYRASAAGRVRAIRGASVAEFALIAGVVFTAVFSVIEFSHYVYVRNSVTAALSYAVKRAQTEPNALVELNKINNPDDPRYRAHMAARTAIAGEALAYLKEQGLGNLGFRTFTYSDALTAPDTGSTNPKLRVFEIQKELVAVLNPGAAGDFDVDGHKYGVANPDVCPIQWEPSGSGLAAGPGSHVCSADAVVRTLGDSDKKYAAVYPLFAQVSFPSKVLGFSFESVVSVGGFGPAGEGPALQAPLPTATQTAIPNSTALPTPTEAASNTATPAATETPLATETSTPVPTNTPVPTGTATETATTVPPVLCTPPPCSAPSDLHCLSGNCAGGCGFVCKPPTPTEVPTETATSSPRPNCSLDCDGKNVKAIDLDNDCKVNTSDVNQFSTLFMLHGSRIPVMWNPEGWEKFDLNNDQWISQDDAAIVQAYLDTSRCAWTPTPTPTVTPTPTSSACYYEVKVNEISSQGGFSMNLRNKLQCLRTMLADHARNLYSTWPVPSEVWESPYAQEYLALRRDFINKYVEDTQIISLGGEVGMLEKFGLKDRCVELGNKLYPQFSDPCQNLAQWLAPNSLDKSIAEQIMQQLSCNDGYGNCELLLDANCKITDRKNLHGKICGTEQIQYTNSPISLLWNGQRQIGNDLSFVNFALDPTTPKAWYTWKGSAAAPLLVYSPMEYGGVSSGAQLFGNWTQIVGGTRSVGYNGSTTGKVWENGFAALATLDRDGNGKIDGDELRDLSLWFDENRDAIVDAGEMRTARGEGVTALYYKTDSVDASTNDIYAALGFERVVNGRLVRGGAVDWFAASANTKEQLRDKFMSRFWFDRQKSSNTADDRDGDAPGAYAAPVKEGGSAAHGAAAHTGLSGIWEWTTSDDEAARALTGVLILQDDNGKISGTSYVEAPVRDHTGGDATTLVRALPVRGTSMKLADGSLAFEFDVGDSDKDVLTTKGALLSTNTREMRARSVAKLDLSKRTSAPTTFDYVWTAKRLFN